MNVLGIVFVVGAIVAIVAFVRMHKRNQDVLRQMEEDEDIQRELGISQIEEYEVSQHTDDEAWRGDVHTDDDNLEDNDSRR